MSEHIIQAFSKTHESGSLAMTVTLGGASITLRGMACAHFAALRYVSRIMTHDLVDPALLQDSDSGELSAAVRERCVSVCPADWSVRLPLKGPCLCTRMDRVHHGSDRAQAHGFEIGEVAERSW